MKVFKAPVKRSHGEGGDKQLENEAKYACLVFFPATHKARHKTVIWKLHSVKIQCESKLNSE